jgi:transposase
MDSTTQAQNEINENGQPGGAAKLMRQVRQATKRRLCAEDKIRIVLEGFRKEILVTDLCRREKISSAVYYAWLKQFMEAGKAQLRHDTLRNATNDEVTQLKEENSQLRELVGTEALELSLLKKRLLL